MRLRNSDRVAYLVAAGLVWSICALNAPPGIAARWPKSEPGKNSAPKSVTVEDVQRILVESKGKPDADVARQLSRLNLTERKSSATLQSLQQTVPGTRSHSALASLADASAFLPTAAADVFPQAPPDSNQQRRMIASSADYLSKTLRKLPDF